MQTFNCKSRPQNSSTVQFCYNTRTCKRTKCRLTYCTYRGEYAPVFLEWYLQYQPDWQNSTEKQRKTSHVHQRKKSQFCFPEQEDSQTCSGAREKLSWPLTVALRNKNIEWNVPNIMKSFKKCLKKENERKNPFGRQSFRRLLQWSPRNHSNSQLVVVIILLY